MNILKFFNKRKKLAISARGGGAKCISYIGVIKALEKNNIPIDFIVGSSGGAVVLMPIAFGYSIDDTVEFARGIKNSEFIGLESLENMTLWSKNKWAEYFRGVFGNKDLSRARIKTFVQLSEKGTKKNILMNKGKVSDLLVATIAYPGLLPPSEIEEHVYYDGDLTSDFAVKHLKKKGANAVIGLAVHEKDYYKKLNDISDLDMLIDGLGLSYTQIDFSHVDELVNHGYEMTMRRIPYISRLL